MARRSSRLHLRVRRRWQIIPLVLAMLAGPRAVADVQDLESAVKATYLTKFAAFVEWPSPSAEFPGGSFAMCLVGEHPLHGLLRRAALGQTVGGHPIVIRRFPSVSGNPGCSVMYVSGPSPQVQAALAAVQNTPVLTVTDGATNAAAEGIINFVIDDNHVRFDINERAAAVNGLTVSSKLLNLAVHVIGAPQ